MKHSSTNLIRGAVMAGVMLFSYTAVNACEFCNKNFTKELTGKRSGTLVATELLATMNNQLPLPYSAPENTGGAGSSGVALPYIVNDDPKLTLPLTGYVRPDTKLTLPPTGYVHPDTKADVFVSITLQEGDVYLGQGVIYKGFTIDGKIPGPTLFATEGDVVEFTVENKGTVPHGASLHMAYTQTSKHLGKIKPGEKRTFKFRVTYPGVYMYHCAPGGHAIPMHILFGQYGMMVVKPKKQYKMEEVLGRKPDVEISLIQHEFYSSGKDAVEGHPIYTVFNGKIFRYVEEPIKVKPGDFVRINFLNVGPNLISTFHIVGIIWDYAYWQGHPENVFVGGQTVLAGPSDSWVVDFRMPEEEGAYTMLSHAVGSTDRGAIGLLMSSKDASTPVVLADGPKYSDAEMIEFQAKSVRTISPFEPGTPDVDEPVIYGPETKEVTIKIIGNSYYPKRVQITKGTTIKWINEDVFTYMEGEFSGIHDVKGLEGPDVINSPMLTHAETYKQTFSKVGKYVYTCTPHPYMKGELVVVKK